MEREDDDAPIIVKIFVEFIMKLHDNLLSERSIWQNVSKVDIISKFDREVLDSRCEC